MILKSSDLLIDTASSLGRKLELKDYFIGSFIVGIGTSLPELFTSIAAVFGDMPQLVVPTIYGTIVANIAAGFGLGVVALFLLVSGNGRTRLLAWRAPMARGLLRFGTKDSPKRFLGIPIAFAAGSVVLTGLFYLRGYFGRWEAVFFLILYAVFLAFELQRKRSDPESLEYSDTLVSPAADAADAKAGSWIRTLRDATRVLGLTALSFGLFLYAALGSGHELLQVFRNNAAAGMIIFLSGLGLIVLLQTALFIRWKLRMSAADFPSFVAASLQKASRSTLVLSLAVSILVVYYSGIVIVEAVAWTSQLLGIGDTVLAASALAVGTSLPDIVVAIKVARAGRHMLLFGHILQSNTFDVYLVMGVCGVISPLVTGHNFEAGLTILASVVFTAALIPLVWTRRVSLLPAGLLLGAYVAFMVLLLV